MALSLEVLGFAAGAPLQGACASYVVSDATAAVLLDCGPGTLERLWRRDLTREVDAIAVSHMHADHMLVLTLYAGDVVRTMVGARRVGLHVPAPGGRDVLRRLDAVFAREPSESTRFDGAFDVREYGAGDRLSIGALSLTFAPRSINSRALRPESQTDTARPS